jgi:hypothetical protein
MAEEIEANSGNEPRSAAGRGSVADRVEALREKTNKLSETVDRVEQTLQEAAGEFKE